MSEDADDFIVVEDPELAHTLSRLEAIKAEIKELQDEAVMLSFGLDPRIRKTALFTNDEGITMRATMVRGRTTNVDLAWFRRHAPEVFVDITKPKVDTEALKRALRSGRITAEMARAAITVTDNKPSVKFTVAGHEQEDETADE